MIAGGRELTLIPYPLNPNYFTVVVDGIKVGAVSRGENGKLSWCFTVNGPQVLPSLRDVSDTIAMQEGRF